MADEVFENGEDALPVADHALEQRAQVRLALAFAVPFGHHRRGNGDIAPQLLGRMSAQKQAVEKGCLTLRELEILQRFVERIGQSRHSEKCSLQISTTASRVLAPKKKYKKPNKKRIFCGEWNETCLLAQPPVDGIFTTRRRAQLLQPARVS